MASIVIAYLVVVSLLTASFVPVLPKRAEHVTKLKNAILLSRSSSQHGRSTK